MGETGEAPGQIVPWILIEMKTAFDSPSGHLIDNSVTFSRGRQPTQLLFYADRFPHELWNAMPHLEYCSL